MKENGHKILFLHVWSSPSPSFCHNPSPHYFSVSLSSKWRYSDIRSKQRPMFLLLTLSSSLSVVYTKLGYNGLRSFINCVYDQKTTHLLLTVLFLSLPKLVIHLPCIHSPFPPCQLEYNLPSHILTK